MKNYKDLFNSANDSIALEQRFYLKEESVRGAMVYPAGSDLFLHLPGGTIDFSQPFESSPQKSGRHNSGIIKKRKLSSFSFATFFNIDEGAVDGKTSIDDPIKVLWKSLMGNEDVSGADAVYDASTAPNVTFTLLEVGDIWSRQMPGSFVQGGDVQLPGDGEASTAWSGNGKTTYLAGIGESIISNDATNIVEVGTGQAAKFTVGAAVMLIENDGTTRSADTPDGAPRIVVGVDTVLDQVTLDGAVFADADGSGSSIFLVYYEPETPTAVNNPVTGLVGSVSIVGLASQCLRSVGVNIQNSHELVDYCYGSDSLAGTLFVPGSRMNAEVSLSMNLSHNTLAFFNRLLEFTTESIVAKLGDSAGRHFELTIPSARFPVPSFSVPDAGSIPIDFSGTAFESSLGAADEITAKFK